MDCIMTKASGPMTEPIRPIIGNLPVGSIVQMPYGGEPREWIIVHQGNPDPAIYDPSCDGCWLRSRELYQSEANTAYCTNAYDRTNGWGTSNLYKVLNSDWLTGIPSSHQALIREAKIPYLVFGDSDPVQMTLGDGLPCKAFILSKVELGDGVIEGYPGEGVNLQFFRGPAGIRNLLVDIYGDLSFQYYWYWTRSRSSYGDYIRLTTIRIDDYGESAGFMESYVDSINQQFFYCPAMILDPNALVDKNGNIMGV